MRFTPLEVAGAHLLDVEPVEDERGGFARAFCREELAAHGLVPDVAQINTSWNPRAGTLRGLHWQDPGEAKVLRCTSGAVFDVVVDVRPGSSTRWRWSGVELRAEQRRAVYVPPGCAHGYLSLTHGAEVLYTSSTPYAPGGEHGLRWDDPALGIAWPRPVEVVSAKDASWPLLPAGAC